MRNGLKDSKQQTTSCKWTKNKSNRLWKNLRKVCNFWASLVLKINCKIN